MSPPHSDASVDLLQEAIRLEREDREEAIRKHSWDGSERRGIPIHILNYMDARLKTHTEHIEQIFTGHTQDEMDRYKAINKAIDDARVSSESRHKAVMEALSGFKTKCRSVESAFLKLPNGEPDFEGHNRDHSSRKRFGDWWDQVKGSTLAKIIEWGSLAFVIWIIHTLWEAFLKGPK